jgi:molecular chaperone GrpE
MTKKEKQEEQGSESINAKNDADEIKHDEPEGVNKEEELKNKKNEMVTIPLSEYAAQMEEIDHLTMKADEFSDGWQRERAEFANYRKRISRDLDTQKIDFKVDIIKKYLAVKDDLDRALKNLPEPLKDEPWISGIVLINQKLSNLLNGEGIETIPAEGLAFDPTVHEAISNEDNDEVESGFIIEVVQQGYQLGNRVIRPALVRVSK